MWRHIFGLKRQTSQAITIVSGLPRSGTSMMMRMLEAGGMAVVVDNTRPPDADNPYGYYEFEQVKKVKDDASFLDHAHGKALKMVFTLLYDLPQNKTYHIIFMQRNMMEVLMSQRIMLQRHGKSTLQHDDARMGQIFAKHLEEVYAWLAKQTCIEVLYVNYDDVMTSPLQQAQRINRFVGNRLDSRKMAAMVDPTLYRNRA
jgi:hypothetical protein